MIFNEDMFVRGHIMASIIRGLNSVIEEDLRNRVENLNISHSGFRILWILHIYDNLIMSDISFYLQLNISSISRQLLKLEKEGYIFIKGGNDARTKLLGLSVKGKQVMKDVIKNDGGSPKFRMVKESSKIPSEDLEKFIEVGSILCSNLLGEEYINHKLI